MKMAGLALGDRPLISAVITGKVTKAGVNKAGALGADLVELRIDTFAERDPVKLASSIGRLKGEGARKLPSILTIRSAKEGGEARLSDTKRLRLYKELIPFTDAVDIELSSKNILKDVVRAAKKERKKVIVSFHDFKATPTVASLKATIRRARKAGADIVKIAALAKTDKEFKRLASLLIEDKNLIVIAMGTHGGAASRVFFPLLGSLVTYASTGRATAPGQMPVKELKKYISNFT